MATYKCIVVSNRLPVSVAKDENGALVFSPSCGGLATAMSSLGNDLAEKLWVGWPGIAADDLTSIERSAITKKLRKFGCYPVFLTRKQLSLFYEGYANDTIWPLFHYFQSLAVFKDEYWRAYKDVNLIYSKAVKRSAAEDCAIWVHDYHLMLLPSLVRTALPRVSIGFFLHIPFPSSEIFRLLPNRRELLAGLLGADLIGFHVYDYVRHFLSSILRIFGLEARNGTLTVDGRVVKTDVFPIGIDYQKITSQLSSAKVQRELKILDEHYKNRKVILSMDRLDYSKGILNRLQAFELFLKENPKYLKNVTLIMIAVPSRTEVETYKTLRESIEKSVSRINGTYATVDWTPISYQFKNLPFEQILALQAKADVALVTPLRDGMNLVAKEYVAAKQNRGGALVLSEMAGAVDELPEALQINPNDIKSISRAIKQALAMPKSEQFQRMQAMQQRLSDYNVKRWAIDFLEQLAKTKNTQTKRNAKRLTASKHQKVINDFARADKRVFFLDYDGTLCQFVNGPEADKAMPSDSLLQILQKLAHCPGTEVCIVSGRTRDALDMWFKNMPLTLVAEHGAWTKQKSSWEKAPIDFAPHKRKLLPILRHYAERTPGALVEEKTCALVWHYRNVPTELAYIRNASLRHELQHLVADTDVSVFSGDKILEIKPRAIHKGNIVRNLLKDRQTGFVLAAGDDYTDESMFEALPDSAHTIKVGLNSTCARHQIVSVESMHALLRDLTKAV